MKIRYRDIHIAVRHLRVSLIVVSTAISAGASSHLPTLRLPRQPASKCYGRGTVYHTVIACSMSRRATYVNSVIARQPTRIPRMNVTTAHCNALMSRSVCRFTNRSSVAVAVTYHYPTTVIIRQHHRRTSSVNEEHSHDITPIIIKHCIHATTASQY